MDRGTRREKTRSKYISRLKKLFNKFSFDEKFESWKDFNDKCRWSKMLRDGKTYGRSAMNKLEKHLRNKKIRQEDKMSSSDVD